MRRNRKNSTKKERVIMLASSAFVLTALTMTGIYMQNKEEESRNDGYTLDFTALEDNAESKYQEIARENTPQIQQNEEYPMLGNLEDDLDYIPMEVGTGSIQIPGLTDIVESENPAAGEQKNTEQQESTVNSEKIESKERPGKGESSESAESSGQQETSNTENVEVAKELHFAESDGLLRPVEGEVLIPFSMDSGVYFSTLKHYKYNPALMLVAAEGMPVAACAEGRVTDIFEDAEIGHAVTMDLGDGYQITYGQLKDISVSLGSYVNPGESVGVVAAPTKYFSVEGANLYLKLTMDGTPVNPENLFR